MKRQLLIRTLAALILYNLTVTTQGFKTQVQENLRVDANTARRLDMQLEVGDVSGTVNGDFPVYTRQRS